MATSVPTCRKHAPRQTASDHPTLRSHTAHICKLHGMASDLLLLIAVTLTMLPKPKTMVNLAVPENGALQDTTCKIPKLGISTMLLHWGGLPNSLPLPLPFQFTKKKTAASGR